MDDPAQAKPMIEIPFEYTLAERDLIRARFVDRKAALGVGNPTLSYTICRTVAARRRGIKFPDGSCIPEPNGLSPRDLANFEKGRMTTHGKLVVIDAYLKIVGYAAPLSSENMAA